MDVANSRTVKVALIVAISVLAMSVLFGLGYIFSQYRFWENQKTIETQRDNAKILNFLNLFIEKVLKAHDQVSFEDRLKLENAVRDLKDEGVLAQWEKFTASKTEAQAQEEAKNLLDILTKRMMGK